MNALPSIIFLLYSLAASSGDMAQSAPPDDDFSPAIFFVFLVICAIFLLFLGMGFAIGLALIALGCLLVALGIVSSSTLAGVLSRRFSTGFRAFHYQVWVALAVPCSIAALWAGATIWHHHDSYLSILVAGTLGGIVAGLAVGFLADHVFRVLYRRLVGRGTQFFKQLA